MLLLQSPVARLGISFIRNLKMDLDEDVIFKHLFSPINQKYKRIYFLGIRSKYPWAQSRLHANTETTVRMEILNVGLSPVLLVWEDNAGERKYTEATINRPAKKINRR